MLRLIQFFRKEGFVWPLCAVALMGWVFHVETRGGGTIPLIALIGGFFVAPYFVRNSVALRYARVKRILLNLFVCVGIVGYLVNRLEHPHIAIYLMQAFISLAFGCLFWAVSDPAYELIEWLSFPTEYGRPPDEIHQLDHRIATLVAGEEPEICWLFRYRYGNEWDVGITGPFTFSLMDTGLDDKPIDEIYAAYGTWSSDKEIREMLRGGPLGGNSSDELNSPS